MWNPNIKAIHITKLVQMIFNAWFGYSEYVGDLPSAITLIVVSYCFDLISINLNWSTRLWSIVQWEISSTKLRKPLGTHSISQRTLSIHCTNLFLCFSCVFTFLEIIKHNMPKMLLFSSIFNIKMTTQKNHQFWCLLKMHADTTAVTIQFNKMVSNEVKDN